MTITRKCAAEASFYLGGMTCSITTGDGLVHGEPFLRAMVTGLVISLPFMILYAVCSMPENLRAARKSLPFTLALTAIVLAWCFSIRNMANRNGLVGEARIEFVAKLVLLAVLFALAMTALKVWFEARKVNKTEENRT